MKHAFIFGTSIYLSNHKAVSFNNGSINTVFLTIRSFFNPKSNPVDTLVIDADINTVDDHHPVRITGNMVQQGGDITVNFEPNRVRLYHAGHEQPILDVYQLDEDEYSRPIQPYH